MAFVTVADLQGFSNLTTDNEAVHQLCINAAVLEVERFLGYGLELRKYSTLHDGNGTNEIQLNARPIKTLLRVSINGELIPLHNFVTEGNEYLIYRNGVFPKGSKNIEVIYWAGFEVEKTPDFGDNILDGGHADTEVFAVDLDGGGALFETGPGNTFPDSIKLCVLRIATLLYTEANNNIGVTGISFQETGSRTFYQWQNFDKYLAPIRPHRLLRIY